VSDDPIHDRTVMELAVTIFALRSLCMMMIVMIVLITTCSMRAKARIRILIINTFSEY